MADTRALKSVFTGIILLAVLGFTANIFLGMMDSSQSYNLIVDNQGSENLDAGNFVEVDNGVLTMDYNVSDTLNVTTTFNDENILDNYSLIGNDVIENDIESYVSEGVNSLSVSVDNTDRVNSLSSEAEFSVNSDHLGVMEKLQTYGPYLIMILMLSLFVLGIAVLLRYLGVL